jgi:hypothetical protein
MWAYECAQVQKLSAWVGSGGRRRRKQADTIGASILRGGGAVATAAEVDKQEREQESEERNGEQRQ